jgi:RHS repeat-associated protein
LTIVAGSLALSGETESSNIGTLHLSGGALRGPNQIFVTSSLVADGGSMEGAGYTVLGEGATGTVSAPAGGGPGLRVAEARSFSVRGSLDVAGEGGKLNVLEAGFLGVVSGGQLTVKGPEGRVEVSDSASFTNAGGLAIEGSKGFVILDSGGPLLNSGTATLKAGEGGLVVKGKSVLENSKTLTMEGTQGEIRLEGTRLENIGTVAVKASEGRIRGTEGARLENSGTLILDGQGEGNGLVAGTGAVPVLKNTGTLLKDQGTKTAIVGFAIDNESLVKAEIGALAFTGGGNSGQTTPGSWTAAGESELLFDQKAFTLGKGAALAGRITVLGSGNVQAPGVAGESATVAVSGGTFELTGAGEESLLQSLSISTGVGRVDKGAHLSVSKEVFLSAGILESASESTMFLNEFLETGGLMTTGSGAHLEVVETLLQQEEGAIHLGTGSTSVFKSGVLLQSRSTGGGVNFEVGEGATATIGGAQLSLLSTPSGKNAPVVSIGKGAVLEGLKQMLSISRGIVTVGEEAQVNVREIFQWEGPLVLQSDAQVSAEEFFQAGSETTIGANASLNAEWLILTSSASGEALVKGPGDLKGERFSWYAGTMEGSGKTTVTKSGESGWESLDTLKQRRLVLEGTFEFGSNNVLMMSDGAVLENKAKFADNTEGSPYGASIQVATGSTVDPKIVNKGEFNKEEGAGLTEVTVPFKNDGIVRQLTGTLRLTRRIGVPASQRFGFRCHCGDPVETASGDLLESQTDIAVGGRGVGLLLSRSYSAMAAAEASAPGLFGYGWTSSFGDRLLVEEAGSRVTLVQADGSTVPFTATEGEAFNAESWSQDKLSGSSGSGYLLTKPDQSRYAFSGAGRLESVTDRNGNKTTLAYDGSGRLKSITDPASRQISLTYNGEGLVESAKDPMGHTVKYGYEGKQLASVTMPGETNPRWRFKYDSAHRLTTLIDGRGGETTNEYDSANRVISQTDPAKRVLGFEYSAFHTKITNKTTGAVSDLWFNSNNEPVAITEGYGTASASTSTYAYDEAGLLIRETDGAGHATEYGYDSEGNRTSRLDAAGNERKWTYNGTHDVVTATTPKGETTTITRDGAGNPEVVSRPAPGGATQTVAYAYNAYGEPKSLTDPLSHVWSFEYDAQGNRIAEVDPEGDKWTWAYDEDSRRKTAVSPRGNEEGAEASKYTTTYERDLQGRPVKITDPLGHVTEFRYDANGNLEKEIDAAGHTTTFFYNADDELTKEERPNGAVLETEYDGAGNVKAQIDGNKHKTEYVHNALNQLTETIDPLGRKTTRKYDAAGNLSSKTDPESRTATYSYDAADHLKEVTYSDGKTPTAKFGYDKDGNLTSVTDGAGEASFQYDQLGRLTHSKDGHGNTVSYEYNLGNQQVGVTYPNGKSVARTFDKAGRLSTVADWLGNTTGFAYNRNSDLTTTTFPVATGNADVYAYDRADAIAEITMKKGAEALASLAYGRDKLGQVETIASKGLPGSESESLVYDLNNRLTKAGSETFAYDAADNLTKTPGSTYSYDAASQLEQGTSVAFSYDKEGERTKETPSRLPVYSSQFGSSGTGNGQFSGASGIAVGPNGRIWVVDTGNCRIQHFNAEGVFQAKFGSCGTKKSEFAAPTAITVDSSGHVWVADTGNSRLQEFNEVGGYINQFGKLGTSTGQFNNPSGIAVGPNGHIWVADTGNNRVQQFDAEGKFISQFGTTGTGNGQFKKPYGIAVSSEERIWVVDKENSRVQQFNAEGKYLSQVGSSGSGAGQFSNPSGVAVGSSGHIWVVDTGNKRVEEFNKAGEYVTKFGEAGAGVGQFNNPLGVANSAESKAWVTDSTNNKVQAWALVEHPTTYKYDQAGNLTAVERAKAGEIPAVSESYGYDGTGLRTSQTVSGATSYFAWDRSSSLPLLLNDGSTSYIYGPGGLPVEQITSGGTPSFYHHDQLGSTRMLTDGSGKATGTFSYGAYGSPSGSSGTMKTPLGYSGQYTAPQSGLQYLRARVYDPVTGQFLARDPIEALTREPYAYAGSSPANNSDPSGLAYEEETPCVWPFCGPNPALEADLERAAGEAQEGVEAVEDFWDSLFGGGDSTTESQPTLTKAEQEYEDEHHECPLERNWKQDKKVTDRELEEADLNAHDLKNQEKGKDIYKDREGNLYVKPKGGRGPGEPLGINIKDHLR